MEYLPQPQQDQLHNLLVTKDFTLFLEALNAELAEAQSKLVEVAIWCDDTERAKDATKKLIYRAQKFTLAIEAINDCYDETHKFKSVKLTP